MLSQDAREESFCSLAYEEIPVGKGQGFRMHYNSVVQHQILQSAWRLHASSSHRL